MVADDDTATVRIVAGSQAPTTAPTGPNSKAQCALVAAKLGRKPLRSGGDTAQVVTSKASPEWPIGPSDRRAAAHTTISHTAELLSAGRRWVKRAREVLEHSDETLVELSFREGNSFAEMRKTPGGLRPPLA